MTTDLLDGLREIGEALQKVTLRARSVYAEEVNALIRADCRDSNRIEHTLDGLLGFCHDPEILLLYRRLCRHYFTIDATGTVFYVNAYREMWDSDDDEKEVVQENLGRMEYAK
jgi:hypothetical protein